MGRRRKDRTGERSRDAAERRALYRRLLADPDYVAKLPPDTEVYVAIRFHRIAVRTRPKVTLDADEPAG